MISIPNNPFRLEELRNLYASKGKISELSKLYKSNYPEIPNHNTGKLWDRLNFNNKEKLDNSPIFKNKMEIVSKYLDNKMGRLLDIGIGIGALEKILHKNDSHLQFYGTDISVKSLKELNLKFKGIVLKRSDLGKIPFPNNYFDYIVVLDVLEHISPNKILKVLKEIRRILKNDGLLIISIPLNEGLESMILQKSNPNAHVRVYTEKLLRAELKISKFKTIETRNLFAFNRFYKFKNFIASKLFKSYWLPNLCILKAEKI